MDNNNKKGVRLTYSKTIKEKEKEYGTIVKVEYSSRTEMETEERQSLRNQLKEQLDNLCSDQSISIIEIVKMMREKTEPLSEIRLDVSVSRGESGEYVYYKNGLVDSCGAYKEIWDDSIVVYTNKEGVDVRFKKEGFHLTSKEQKEEINKELDGLYDIVITLANMLKPNEKRKVKKEGETNGQY